MKEFTSILRAELEADIQTFKADLVQWICVVFMGQTTMLLVMLYFFVKYVK